MKRTILISVVIDCEQTLQAVRVRKRLGSARTRIVRPMLRRTLVESRADCAGEFTPIRDSQTVVIAIPIAFEDGQALPEDRTRFASLTEPVSDPHASRYGRDHCETTRLGGDWIDRMGAEPALLDWDSEDCLSPTAS